MYDACNSVAWIKSWKLRRVKKWMCAFYDAFMQQYAFFLYILSYLQGRGRVQLGLSDHWWPCLHTDSGGNPSCLSIITVMLSSNVVFSSLFKCSQIVVVFCSQIHRSLIWAKSQLRHRLSYRPDNKTTLCRSWLYPPVRDLWIRLQKTIEWCPS